MKIVETVFLVDISYYPEAHARDFLFWWKTVCVYIFHERHIIWTSLRSMLSWCWFVDLPIFLTAFFPLPFELGYVFKVNFKPAEKYKQHKKQVKQSGKWKQQPYERNWLSVFERVCLCLNAEILTNRIDKTRIIELLIAVLTNSNASLLLLLLGCYWRAEQKQHRRR